jgi:hypothetical protein
MTKSDNAADSGPPPPPPGYYRIDVRVFLVFLTTVMAASFVAGVVLVPPLGELLHQKIAAAESSRSTASSNGGGISTTPTAEVLTSPSPEKAKVVRDAYLINASEGWAKSAKEKAEKAKNGELHLPAGQHLLVDMKGVDGSFLNSEERLSKAIVDTVKLAG